MNTTALTVQPAEFAPIVTLVLDSLTSSHSRRAYSKALTDFLTWYDAHAQSGAYSQGRPTLSKALVQKYKRYLQDLDLAPSTINQRLSAIRKLATEAADNNLLDPTLAAGISRVKGVTAGGRRSGNWLARKQAQALLDAPDTSTPKGLRDRAILAVLIGAGLRRAEAARLTFDDVQQRDGRWVLVDIVGKRNKTRTVPLPSWAKAAIDAWAEAAGRQGTAPRSSRTAPGKSLRGMTLRGSLTSEAVTDGRIFRAVNKAGRVVGEGLTPQAIHDVVTAYAGAGVAPHDLRRTFAKLAHRGGSGLDQIQLSLGHASIQTTERYLGLEQDLTDAPCDRLGLRLDYHQKGLPGIG